MKNTDTQIAAVAAIVGSALTAVGLVALNALDRRKEKHTAAQHGKPMTFRELYEDNAVDGLFSSFERSEHNDS